MINWFGFKVDENNIPLELPGCYLIIHISSRKKYVGKSINIFTRLKAHSMGCGGAIKLDNAIKKHGIQSFLVIPLWYLYTNTQNSELNSLLIEVESVFISLYDSIKNGYNIIERGPTGGFGEEYKKLRKQLYQDKQIRSNISKAAKEAWARTDVREKHRLASKDKLKEKTRNSWRQGRTLGKPKTSSTCKHCGVKFTGRSKKHSQCRECLSIINVRCTCGCNTTISREVYKVLFPKRNNKLCTLVSHSLRAKSNQIWSKESTGSSIQLVEGN